MWLVHIARVLKLKSVSPKSFAEYHSKINPVESVHAAQNHTLSNEQFSSKGIHSEYEKGDEKHKISMEHMADEVRKCQANTQYGIRGIGGQENVMFTDEEHLVTFLGKNENQKTDDNLEDQPIKADLWREVSTVWDMNENYTGSYREEKNGIWELLHSLSNLSGGFKQVVNCITSPGRRVRNSTRRLLLIHLQYFFHPKFWKLRHFTRNGMLITDLLCHIKYAKLNVYTDDHQIYSSNVDPHALEECICKEVNVAKQWY